MGLLDSLSGYLPQGGLLGMGGAGGFSSPANSLLAPLGIDQAAMRNYELKRGLLNAGVALLSQKPQAVPFTFGQQLGTALGGGLQGAQDAQDSYINNAMTAQQVAGMGQQRQLTQLQIEQAQRDAGNKDAFDKFVTTLSPEEQNLARVDPTGYAGYYFGLKKQAAQGKMVGDMMQGLGGAGPQAQAAPSPQMGQAPAAPPMQPGATMAPPQMGAQLGMPQQQGAPVNPGYAGPDANWNSIPVPDTVMQAAITAGMTNPADGAKLIMDYKKQQSDQSRQDYYQSPAYLTQKGVAEGQAKRTLDAPATIVQTQNKMMALDDMKRSVNDVLNDPGLDGIAGLYGKLPIIPGTARANAAAKLDALKTKTAFSALQALREGSPTGGALGQISDKEETMLQNSISSLDKAQSPQQLRQSLNQILDFVDRHQASIKGEFKATYGTDVPPLDVPAKSQNTSSAPPSIDDLLKKYGGR